MKKFISILTLYILLFSLFSSYIAVYAADEEIEWADFSKATFGVKKDNFVGSISYSYTIESIIRKDESTYFKFQITNSTEKPSITDEDLTGINKDSKWQNCSVNKEGQLILDSFIIEEYLEKSEDFYLWVLEWKIENTKKYFNEAVSAKKIEKPDILQDYGAFFVTSLSEDNSRIIINAPKGKNTVRQINVKIGRITDNAILSNLKNNKSNSFSDLLKYSQSASSIYSKKITSNCGYSVGYDSREENASEGLINLYDLIENDQYYYLYVNVDDENGKYCPIEAVTLCKASKYEKNDKNKWFMSFYSNEGFDFGENIEKDLDSIIIFPLEIRYSGEDNKTDAKLSVNSKITDYSLYYQYAIMDEATYTEFNKKQEELKEYVDKLKQLKKDFEEKQKKDPNSEETELAFEEYGKVLNEYDTKFNALKTMIPKYNDSAWVETKDGSIGNLSFLNNYAKDDNVALVLWAKLEVGEDTYYDYGIYKMNGTKINNPTITEGLKTSGDTTVAPNILPYTGGNIVLFIAIAGLLGISFISYRKYKKWQIIK